MSAFQPPGEDPAARGTDHPLLRPGLGAGGGERPLLLRLSPRPTSSQSGEGGGPEEALEGQLQGCGIGSKGRVNYYIDYLTSALIDIFQENSVAIIYVL